MSSFYVRISIEDSQAINKRKREEIAERDHERCAPVSLAQLAWRSPRPADTRREKNSAGREIRWRHKREA